MRHNFEDIEKKLLFFGDVLGFSRMVDPKQALPTDSLTCNVRTFYKDFIARAKRYKKDGIDIILFSDSIIIMTKEEKANDLLSIIAWFYNQFLCMGMIMRGAICYDTLKYDSKCSYLVGKAQVKAVELEKKAFYPRIVLSEEAEHIMPDKKYIVKDVCSNLDNLFTFDVLKKYLDDLTFGRQNIQGLIEPPLSVWTSTLCGYVQTATEETHKKKLHFFQSYLVAVLNSYDFQFERITPAMISGIVI